MPFSVRSCSLALCLVCLSVHPLQAQKSDWPGFRGPTGMGISSDKGIPTTWGPSQNIAWKVALPGAGTSSPIIVGNRIFLGCYSGFGVPGVPDGPQDALQIQLLCLDRDTGKTLWSKTIKPKLPEQARIRETHGYASATPVSDGERVYFFLGKSGVHAYDLDGKFLWQADVGSKLNGWGSAASPALHRDLLLVNASVESETLFALDKQTGKERWRTPGIRESWSTPLVVNLDNGNSEIVIAMFGKILGIDPKSGSQLWSCKTDIGWYMVPTMVEGNGITYAIGGRSGVAGLAVRNGGKGDVTATHRLWKSNKGSNVSSPILYKGHLYWMNDAASIAYCADAKTGNVLYEERINALQQVYASPVLVDGRIIYLGRNGKALVVSAKPTFEQLAINDLSDRSMFNASPAVAAGKLFIRSDKNLYCIGSK